MLAQPYLEIVCGLVGLAAGSLIVYSAPRLVAYRLPEPIPFPSAWVLLPVVGILREQWRVRSSLLVEAVTALVLVLLAVRYGSSIQLVITGAYSVVFVAMGYIDIDHRLVLNRMSYPAIALAFPISLVWPNHGWRNALLGAATAGLIFVVLQVIGQGRLGTGDTKLAILIGAVHGFPDVLNSLIMGMLFGGIAGILLMVVLRRGRKEYFAYAPYLAAGAIVSFLVSLS